MNNEFKVGDLVSVKGGIGPKMVISRIDYETRMSKPVIKAIQLKWFDDFLSEWKFDIIFNFALIEHVNE